MVQLIEMKNFQSRLFLQTTKGISAKKDKISQTISKVESLLPISLFNMKRNSVGQGCLFTAKEKEIPSLEPRLSCNHQLEAKYTEHFSGSANASQPLFIAVNCNN